MSDEHRAAILKMLILGIEPLGRDGPFDFGNIELPTALKDEGLDLARNKELWHVPPAETVFIQRKLGGIYMLATRLQAKVNVTEIIRRHLNL